MQFFSTCKLSELFVLFGKTKMNDNKLKTQSIVSTMAPNKKRKADIKMEPNDDEEYNINSNCEQEYIYEEVPSPNGTSQTDTSYTTGNVLEIKKKLLCGEYKIVMKKGRSKVWSIFARVGNHMGEEITHIVVCTKCKNVYKFDERSTSNLLKHKCYILMGNVSEAKTPTVGEEFQHKSERIFTEWMVENCRPYEIWTDNSFRNIFELLIEIGAIYGTNVDVKSILPNASTITQNIENLYKRLFHEIFNEINTIKDNGYGLSINLWTDNSIQTSFLIVTMHYVKQACLVNRYLGFKSLTSADCTSENIKTKIDELLAEFGCQLDEKAVILTDRKANMISTFQNNNNVVFCVNTLLKEALKAAIEDVEEVELLTRRCTELIQYLKRNVIDTVLKTAIQHCLKNTKWNTNYYELVAVETLWDDIKITLHQQNALERLHGIHLKDVNELLRTLRPFEETTKKLQCDQNAKLYMVYMHLSLLKKKCNALQTDSSMIKQFKEKLLTCLDTIIYANLKSIHKIALYLFPPANKLIQFDEVEKQNIMEECKRHMSIFAKSDTTKTTLTNETQSDCSISIAELFDPFVYRPDCGDANDRVSNELNNYSNCLVKFHEDFNVLLWWEAHKAELPLLYKLSCKILATPATGAAMENAFYKLRSLLRERSYCLDSNDAIANKIMFLHINDDRTNNSDDIETSFLNM